MASANSCPSSARGATGAREVGDPGGRPRSFEKSFPRAESSLLSSRAGAEEASPHPGPSSGFQARGRHCRSWLAREHGLRGLGGGVSRGQGTRPPANTGCGSPTYLMPAGGGVCGVLLSSLPVDPEALLSQLLGNRDGTGLSVNPGLIVGGGRRV